MTRVLIATLLFLSLSYQLFVKLAVVVWYEYNKDYIAKNLCENRNKPEKNCCGKCVLRKQLKKADDAGNTPSGRTIPSKWNLGEEVVFLVPQEVKITLLPCFTNFKMPLFSEECLSYSPLNEVFRPPLFC